MQTHENVTKCFACHAKPRYNLLWHLGNSIGFADSLIDTSDTARPQENQRLETRHVGASKRAFRPRHPPIFVVVASKSTFSYEFSYEPQHLLPQNRCFVRGFCEFSAHLTTCHAHHAICTLSPLDAALTMRFAKTRNTTRLKRCACHAKWRWRSPKCCACHEKCASYSWNDAKVYRACQTKRLSTRYQARLNVTKCHACHVKRGYTALETSKSDPFFRTRHRHGHTGLTRPPANGCGRSRTVAPATPTRPPEWHGNPCYAFGKMVIFHSYASFPEGIHLSIPQSCPCFQVGQIQVLHPVETHEAAADGVKS